MEHDTQTRQRPGTFVSPSDEETKCNQARAVESRKGLPAVSYTERATTVPAETLASSKRSPGCLQILHETRAICDFCQRDPLELISGPVVLSYQKGGK